LAEYPALDVRWAPAGDVETLCDLIHATIDDFEPLSIHDRDSGDGWRVFFRTAPQRNDASSALAAALGDRLTQIEPVDVPDDGWARRSQENLKAISVGSIVVAPPWDVPLVSVQSPVVIVIEPSTGFGTGHHETTRLCLELLQELDPLHSHVIDVGTGSGVLAIAAAKLGAASVVAIDHDEEALRSARENIARNAAEAVVEVAQSDLASCDLPPADLVLANLTAAAIIKHASRLTALVGARGALIISGISPDDLRDVTKAFGRAPRRVARAGEWVAAIL
jgi:ribosomal protein L11 methyltransferase